MLKITSFLLNLLVIFSPFLVMGQEKKFDSYGSYGKDFSAVDLRSIEDLSALYERLEPKDSIEVVFEATVTEVCRQKGCWMKTETARGNEIMIKFEDYAFFVPKDVAGKEVVVHGRAYVTEISAEDRRHYAEDAGKSAEESGTITTPKRTYSFLATGVKIRN